jgi:ankyrin repeat protein
MSDPGDEYLIEREYEENVLLRMRIVELETENRNLKYQVDNQRALLESLQNVVMQSSIKSNPEVLSVSDSLLNTAVIRGDVDIVTSLLESETNVSSIDSALQSACQHGREEIAEILLRHGANPHADHDCALVWACHSGEARVVRLLIKHGADPEALHGLPMRIAVGSGNAELVRALVSC